MTRRPFPAYRVPVWRIVAATTAAFAAGVATGTVIFAAVWRCL